MKSRIILWVTVLLAVMPVQAFAAGSASERLSQFVQNIGTFNRILPQEKVYLHFDNTAYYIGDTLWFAAYVVTAPDHRATPLSRVLHVQLITREGTVVDTRVLKISEDGRCHGQFVLKSEYASGYYEVRAYTLYMLNFGNIQWDYEKEAAAFFFNEEYCRRFYQESGTAFSRVFPVYQKPLTPGNWNEKTIRTRPRLTGTLSDWWERDPKPVLKFYPEGGHLVEGLESRVAFEVCDAEGKPLQVKGEIEGRRGRTRQALRSNARGRGDFYYTPEKGQPCRAVITWEGKDYRYDLPEPLTRGYVMTVRQEDDRQGGTTAKVIRIDVAGTDSLPSGSLGLSVVCRGQPYVFEELRTVRQSDGTLAARIDIGTELLPEGVQQITLFDDRGQIHAERMAFVSHPERRTARMALSGQKRSALSPYEKISLDFSLSDGDKPIETAFSLSVCDEQGREQTATEEDILSHLLLSSDLYGAIEEPAAYFRKGARSQYELELLMLTQGWRRYDFREMTGQESFVYRYRPQQGLSVSGQVFPMKGNRRTRERQLQQGMEIEALIGIDSFAIEGTVQAGKQGEFSFQLPDFEGTGHLFLNTHFRQDSSETPKSQNIFRRIARYYRESLQSYGEGDFFNYETDRNGYWANGYLPIKESWQPHVRLLSYYETHPLEYRQEETLAQALGLTLAESGASDEAYNLSLKDVDIEGKRTLRRMDLSQPAIRLDARDEMNLQLDLGMFYGLFDTTFMDYCALMRHGVRGRGRIVSNFGKVRENPDSEGIADNPNEGEAIEGAEDIDTSLETMGDSYNGLRREDQSYFMQHYMKGRDEVIDVIHFGDPDSVKFVARVYLEMLRTISIYSDKTSRQLLDLELMRDAYTDNYVLHNELYQDDARDWLPIPRSGRNMRIRGFSRPAEFYSPDYSKRTLQDAPKDYRRTLYWNPEVKTDQNGRAHIEFYNNATARFLVISAEGLSPGGQAIILEE